MTPEERAERLLDVAASGRDGPSLDERRLMAELAGVCLLQSVNHQLRRLAEILERRPGH